VRSVCAHRTATIARTPASRRVSTKMSAQPGPCLVRSDQEPRCRRDGRAHESPGCCNAPQGDRRTSCACDTAAGSEPSWPSACREHQQVRSASSAGTEAMEYSPVRQLAGRARIDIQLSQGLLRRHARDRGIVEQGFRGDPLAADRGRAGVATLRCGPRGCCGRSRRIIAGAPVGCSSSGSKA